ncbi:hypothetical protein L226DRAFT_533375, partial [Lentinus tigrinus ALCF2SS1-7]|uniref:uncharacterized protein n=1 Tax=Lentinus tigrinus ALCF2SS1-7 TaxID=1328758 RepID=UPI001165DBA5
MGSNPEVEEGERGHAPPQYSDAPSQDSNFACSAEHRRCGAVVAAASTLSSDLQL